MISSSRLGSKGWRKNSFEMMIVSPLSEPAILFELYILSIGDDIVHTLLYITGTNDLVGQIV